LFDLNAKLPKSYIAIFLLSQGLSGVASNVLRLMSLWLYTTGVESESQSGSSVIEAAFN